MEEEGRGVSGRWLLCERGQQTTIMMAWCALDMYWQQEQHLSEEEGTSVLFKRCCGCTPVCLCGRGSGKKHITWKENVKNVFSDGRKEA